MPATPGPAATLPQAPVRTALWTGGIRPPSPPETGLAALPRARGVAIPPTPIARGAQVHHPAALRPAAHHRTQETRGLPPPRRGLDSERLGMGSSPWEVQALGLIQSQPDTKSPEGIASPGLLFHRPSTGRIRLNGLCVSVVRWEEESRLRGGVDPDPVPTAGSGPLSDRLYQLYDLLGGAGEVHGGAWIGLTR